MQDYLDEDPAISTQKYCIMSYVLSEKNPMVKIRGSFSSVEECENKIKRLQSIDTYFHMFIIEVGKWGALLKNDELENIDVKNEFMNEQLNSMMKNYKESRDKATDAYEQRKRQKIKEVRQDGTPEGQKALSSKPEHPASVKSRMESSREVLEKIKKDLEEYTKIYEEASEKYSKYSEEELSRAEEDLKKLNID